MPQTVLQVENLTKKYGSFTALDSVSFNLEEGEILGLLGPNGSGKTTTIQMLLNTLTPTSGSILYFGKSFSKHSSEILRSISFASTYTSLPYILTIEENLECFGRLYGLKNIQAKATPLLERFGILEKKKKLISSLSAGQITRLMLVKAFFTEPKIVLLDEPTASLDPDVSADVCSFLLEERKKRGLSILFTSHKMDEVAELCDRAIFLRQGKILANDTPKKLAQSVSQFKVRLTISDGMKRTITLAETMKAPYQVDHRVLSLSLDETSIPIFLSKLVKMDITYSSIQIKEPSLETYFLSMAEKQL